MKRYVIIGNGAFSSCSNLQRINLDYVTEVCDYAFNGTGLTEPVTFRADAVTIGDEAFRYSKVPGIKFFSRNVSLTGVYTFVNMDSLKYVFFSRDTVLSGSSSSMEYFGYCKNLETVVLPGNISLNSEEEFSSCPNLCVYAPPESNAVDFARRLFLVCSTNEYENMYSLFAAE